MASTSNQLSPQIKSAPSAFWRVAIRVGLFLALAAAYAWIYFFSTAAPTLHDRATLGLPGDPAWFSVLICLFLLIPILTTFVLVSQKRKPKWMAAGAGVSLGFFGLLVLLSPLLLISMFLLLGLSGVAHGADPTLEKSALALVALIAISLWIVLCSFFIGKYHWVPFLVTASITGVCVLSGLQKIRYMEYRIQQRAERAKEKATMVLNAPAGSARDRVLELTACLNLYRTLHPGAGYPPSLESLAKGWDWACDTKAESESIPEFTFAYAPQKDASTGRVVDFQLTAIPKQKGVQSRNPLMTDSRGIVFVDYPWFMENALPHVEVIPSELGYSQIEAFQSDIERYTKEKAGGRAPAMLTQEMFANANFGVPDVEEGGVKLRERNYEVEYAPAKKGDPSRFTLSVRCTSYGQQCLRSYFADFDGALHATGDPRNATKDDPAPPQCEEVMSECKDIVWSVP
jgi:hypothetical protein